jgi:hypothetical protein
VIILCCSTSVISKRRSACVWSRNGIRIVGNATLGNATNLLNYPEGIFIHQKTNTLYIADSKNHRIQKTSLDDWPADISTVISTKTSPKRIYVDNDNNDELTIYVVPEHSNCLEKWIQNVPSVVPMGKGCNVSDGVSVDKGKNIYMADYFRHCVQMVT